MPLLGGGAAALCLLHALGRSGVAIKLQLGSAAGRGKGPSFLDAGILLQSVVREMFFASSSSLGGICKLGKPAVLAYPICGGPLRDRPTAPAADGAVAVKRTA